MKLRTWAGCTALAVATSMGGGAIFAAADTSPAAAARPAQAPVTTSAPCTVGGAASTCAVNLTHLQVVDRTLQAGGTVTGTDPATGNVFSAPFANVPVDPASCKILSLTLGPLHLNLLGLVVDIPNPIVLNITAVPGPGNLLGNLLCSVTHLLDNTGTGNGLTALLNNINKLLAGL